MRRTGSRASPTSGSPAASSPGSTGETARPWTASGRRALPDYLNDRGFGVLDVLDELAAAHDTTVAAVALAWLAAQPTVAAPIASARTPEQLAELLPMAALELGTDDLARLDAASA